MEALVAAISHFSLFAVFTDAVPPDACFATFRWDDCGQPPQPVMYYWKPGSRCEVGIWKGCLPNLNMFKDEYECVSTCIFTVRAQPLDYHRIHVEDDTTMLSDYEDSTTGRTDTTGGSTGDESAGTGDGAGKPEDNGGEGKDAPEGTKPDGEGEGGGGEGGEGGDEEGGGGEEEEADAAK